MAHFALSDVAGHRYTSFQRISREAVGLAGAQLNPFQVWLDDWRLEALPGRESVWRFRAGQDGIGIDLELEARKPPVLQGNQGLSQKSAEVGNASYYYSMTRLAARGTVTVPGRVDPVSGLAWLDREWSTSMLAPDQAGWDWFSLQLNDGSDLMYFRMRRKDGSDDPHSSGAVFDAGGGPVRWRCRMYRCAHWPPGAAPAGMTIPPAGVWSSSPRANGWSCGRRWPIRNFATMPAIGKARST